jgi:hypothetical protein
MALGAATVIGLAAFALFQASANADHESNAGDLTILLDPSGSGNRLSVPATRLVAGDTIERVVNVTPTGSVDATALHLTTEATASSVLDTDTTNGLQLTVTRCSVAWTETLTSGIPTSYSCSGSTSTALTARAAIVNDQTLESAVTMSGSVNHFLIRLELPTNADNTFINRTSVIRFTFSGVQRGSEYK